MVNGIYPFNYLEHCKIIIKPNIIMKLIKSLFLVAILAIAGNLIAQDKVGYIKYEITNIQSDNPQIQQQASMMKNGYMEQYIGKDKVLSVVNMMGMVITKTLADKESGDATMYMDMMGRKIMIPMTKEQMDKQEATSTDAEITSERVAGATKDILGYTAHKTLIKVTTDEGSTTMEIWTTDELSADADNFSKMMKLSGDNVKIEGVPLEFTIDANGMMKMTYTASAVKMVGETDYSAMKIDDSGYKKMTFEEFQQTMGGRM